MRQFDGYRASLWSNLPMIDFNTEIASFSMRGGDLSLDYVNHMKFASSHESEAQLEQYTRFVAWSRQAGIVTDGEGQHLIRHAERHPAETAILLQQAQTVQDVLRRIFVTVAERRQPDTADLAAFNSILAKTLQHRRIALHGDSFVWEWEKQPDALDYPLWPVVQSAADLL